MQNFLDNRMKQLVTTVVVALTFFLFMAGLNAMSEIAVRKKATVATNVITFRGTSEINAVPDVSTFNITIREEEKDVAQAQQKMTDKSNKLLALFGEKGVEKKDIQTANYSTSPKYIYQAEGCRNGFCPQGKQVLTGYEATQTITVKLRDFTKTGEILSAISALAIYEVSGPSFMVDDIAKLKSQAQAEAILKAKSEAKITAKNLGVKLGKIVRYYEEPNQFAPRPMMMAKMAFAESTAAPMPSPIEGGEQKVVANVSITYEIVQ